MRSMKTQGLRLCILSQEGHKDARRHNTKDYTAIEDPLFVQRSEPVLLRGNVVIKPPVVELELKSAYEIPMVFENCSVVSFANWINNCPL